MCTDQDLMSWINGLRKKFSIKERPFNKFSVPQWAALGLPCGCHRENLTTYTSRTQSWGKLYVRFINGHFTCDKCGTQID
jgi:hypothetical protein